MISLIRKIRDWFKEGKECKKQAADEIKLISLNGRTSAPPIHNEITIFNEDPSMHWRFLSIQTLIKTIAERVDNDYVRKNKLEEMVRNIVREELNRKDDDNDSGSS